MQRGRSVPRRNARTGCWALLAILWVATLSWPMQAGAHVLNHAAKRGAAGFGATLDGHVVQHKRVGYQPDFDPIDRVVISSMLRHVVSAGRSLPDSMLVLSLYLENFTATTTPLLPDLLHPDQAATGLSGFMQGKAVLVTAAGKKGYNGSALAEVFLDNTVHLVLDLAPAGADPSAPTQRLLGTFSLAGDLSVQGEVHGQQPLSARILGVPPGHPVPWQSVVARLSVHLPPMMGTAASRLPLQQATAPAIYGAVSAALHPASRPAPAVVARAGTDGRPIAALSAATLAALAAIAIVLLRTLRPRRVRRA